MKTIHVSAVLAVALLLVSSAMADFTTATGSGEPNHKTVLASIYGGTFTGTADFGAASYSNSSVTLTRVDDFFGSSTSLGSYLNLLTGTPGSTSSDQIWTDGIATAHARARYADYAQQFGYYDGASGTVSDTYFNAIGDYVGSGVQDTDLGTIDFMDDTWRWGRRGSGLIWGSRTSENADGLDHLITYKLTAGATPGVSEWVLFWDDQHGGGDRDFNDFVVQITAVPAPGAALLGVVGLSAVAWMRRRIS